MTKRKLSLSIMLPMMIFCLLICCSCVEIHKVANPDDGTEFQFISDASGHTSFSLQHGEDESWESSGSVTYNVTEFLPQGWTLVDIDCGSCDSPDCTRDGNSIIISVHRYNWDVDCYFINQGPGINITKTADEESVDEGDIIHYTYQVTNNAGSGNLTQVMVTDDLCSPLSTPEKTGGDQDDILEDGETWTYTCDDIAACMASVRLTNTATATATANVTDLDPIPVMDQDTETVYVFCGPLANPPLVESCGMDIVLVLDSSDSVNLDDVRNPAYALVTALTQPDSQNLIGVVEFDSEVVSPTLDLTNDVTNINNRISAISQYGSSLNEFTNWEAGLTEARLMLENAGGYGNDRDDTLHPDLIVLISDGTPTVHGYPAYDGFYFGTEPDDDDINGAVFGANMAKSSTGPIRIVYVGVDSTLTYGTQVSGPTTTPVDSNVDAILAADVEAMATAVAELINECQGSITVIKEVVGTPLQPIWQFTGDREFTIASTGGSETFNNLDAGTYTISETPAVGYRTEINCTNCANCQTANGSVTIDLGYGDEVTCTFTNTLDPTLLPSPGAGAVDQATGITGEAQSTTMRTGDLRVSMLKVPGQTVANKPMTITANVVNDGNETGSKRVALKINGRVEQTKLVTVGGGGSRPVKFTVKKAEPGTYTVIMDSQRASFVVTEDTGQASTDGSTIAVILLAVVFGAVILVLILSYGRRPSY